MAKDVRGRVERESRSVFRDKNHMARAAAQGMW
jgi:hypothetical protein